MIAPARCGHDHTTSEQPVHSASQMPTHSNSHGAVIGVIHGRSADVGARHTTNFNLAKSFKMPVYFGVGQQSDLASDVVVLSV